MTLFNTISGSSTDFDTDLSLDEAVHLLTVERRRLVLERLADDPGPHSKGDLAEALAIESYGREYTGTQRKREYVSLYQKHLPVLDDHGVIEFDEDRGTVQRGPEFKAALETLRSVEEVVRA